MGTLHIGPDTSFAKFNYKTQFSLIFGTSLLVTFHLKCTGFIVILSTINSEVKTHSQVLNFCAIQRNDTGLRFLCNPLSFNGIEH